MPSTVTDYYFTIYILPEENIIILTAAGIRICHENNIFYQKRSVSIEMAVYATTCQVCLPVAEKLPAKENAKILAEYPQYVLFKQPFHTG